MFRLTDRLLSCPHRGLARRPQLQDRPHVFESQEIYLLLVEFVALTLSRNQAIALNGVGRGADGDEFEGDVSGLGDEAEAGTILVLGLFHSTPDSLPSQPQD